ncbi:MAG TPA: hypothetical protein VE715_17725 [Blastocatellia bacterium]|nr:hypothetical protein [Blastocatellia bacterium]
MKQSDSLIGNAPIPSAPALGRAIDLRFSAPSERRNKARALEQLRLLGQQVSNSYH